jgi:GGDEF domain-containing protein
VILAQADRPQAEEKAQHLLDVIKTSPMDWEGNEITLSCAVGIHQFSGEQSADDALSQADASMYKEKKKHYQGKPPRGQDEG